MLYVVGRGRLREERKPQEAGLCIGVYCPGMKLGASLKWELMDSSYMYNEQSIGTIIKGSIHDALKGVQSKILAEDESMWK